jgi:hypothetical protein
MTSFERVDSRDHTLCVRDFRFLRKTTVVCFPIHSPNRCALTDEKNSFARGTVRPPESCAK